MKNLKKIKVVLMVLLSSMLTNVKSQNVVDFDALPLQPDTFWNGSDLSGGFTDGGSFFVNYYDTSYGGYWSGGFAYSNMVDTVTAGYTNMYSVMAGVAQSGSNFAIAQPGAYNTTYLLPMPVAKIAGIYITNSTYAYISMRDGDSFAKKFGGPTGDDPDWFKLTIKGYLNGNFTDSVEFYLADYRFTDNSQDYIVKDWTWVDMLAMGNVDSVVFSLSSSDVGQYGMNTPAYFCLDHIQYMTTGINQQENEMALQVYPNPVIDKIFVEANSKISKLELLSIDGKILLMEEPNAMKTAVNIDNFPKGIYFLSLFSERGVVNTKIIKE